VLALGIDPGTATVGYGLVRELKDGSLQAVHYGVIRTPAHTPMPERLATIYDEMTAIIATYKPDIAAIEELFFGKNATTGITVAQGRGVLLLAMQKAGLEIGEYKPNMIKQSITGYGGADKPQMQEMIRVLLGLDSIPKPDDAADGLAIAITHIQLAPYRGEL
jgi:crossover junction endodeoxyribonuclease RuvC